MCESLECTVCVTACVWLRAQLVAGASVREVRARGVQPPPGPRGRRRSPRRGGVCGGAEPTEGRARAEESGRSRRGSRSPGAAARPGCMEGPPPPDPPGARTLTTA